MNRWSRGLVEWNYPARRNGGYNDMHWSKPRKLYSTEIDLNANGKLTKQFIQARGSQEEMKTVTGESNRVKHV